MPYLDDDEIRNVVLLKAGEGLMHLIDGQALGTSLEPEEIGALVRVYLCLLRLTLAPNEVRQDV
jgi:hypothetical protein